MSEKKELNKDELKKVSGGVIGLYDENTDGYIRDTDMLEHDKEAVDLSLDYCDEDKNKHDVH